MAIKRKRGDSKGGMLEASPTQMPYIGIDPILRAGSSRPATGD